jgi:hypothetical protein
VEKNIKGTSACIPKFYQFFGLTLAIKLVADLKSLSSGQNHPGTCGHSSKG